MLSRFEEIRYSDWLCVSILINITFCFWTMIISRIGRLDVKFVLSVLTVCNSFPSSNNQCDLTTVPVPLYGVLINKWVDRIVFINSILIFLPASQNKISFDLKHLKAKYLSTSIWCAKSQKSFSSCIFVLHKGLKVHP